MTNQCSAIIRELRLADETSFRDAHRQLAEENFTFGLGWQDDITWPNYLQQLSDTQNGIDLPDGLVPATFLVAVIDEVVVGRVSIRHQLNDFLRREGGHVGYAVVPRMRRRGIGTQLLQHGIEIARSVGVEDVLLFCDPNNIGSAKIIQSCGGVFERNSVRENGLLNSRYVIAGGHNSGQSPRL